MAMFEKIRRDPCSMEKTIRLPPYKGKEKVGESPKRPWLELQVQELGSILSWTRGSFPRLSFLGLRN